MPEASPTTWRVFEPGTTDYPEALKLQHRLVAARQSGALDTDLLIVLEHPPVFTLGRRGGLENLTVPRAFLATAGIQVAQAERGGNITYHGPGQLVAYPIVDLDKAKRGIRNFVWMLEEVMIRTAAAWSVTAERNPANRGIWVANSKMGSIGIAIRRGISFHGLALNVSVSLEPFGWINPCGLRDVGITTLQRASGRKLDLAAVQREFKRQIKAVFNARLRPVNRDDINRWTTTEM